MLSSQFKGSREMVQFFHIRLQGSPTGAVLKVWPLCRDESHQDLLELSQQMRQTPGAES